jgi:hypothetical protein
VTVKLGEVGATVGGKPAVVTLTDDDGSVIATVDGATISYSVIASDGTKRPISVSSFSIIKSGDRVTLEFGGFKSSTKSRAWLNPSGVVLGETTLVGGNGTVQGTVPNTVDGDDVRVVAAADSEDGEPIVIAYGVQVDEDSSSQSPWSVVLLIVVGLAIVGGFAVPAVRRRQQVS